jgi:hypothetical protein
MQVRVRRPGRLQHLTRSGSGVLLNGLAASVLFALPACDASSVDARVSPAQEGTANQTLVKVASGLVDISRHSSASVSPQGGYGYLWGPDTGSVTRWTDTGGGIMVETIRTPPGWVGTAAQYSDSTGMLWLADSTGREWNPRSQEASNSESPTTQRIFGMTGAGRARVLLFREGDSIRLRGIAGGLAMTFHLDTASTPVLHSGSRMIVWDSESGTAIEVGPARILRREVDGLRLLDASRDDSKPTAKWRLRSSVELGPEILVSLTDLNSADRRLALIDSSFRVVKCLNVPARLTVLARASDAGLVLAASGEGGGSLHLLAIQRSASEQRQPGEVVSCP